MTSTDHRREDIFVSIALIKGRNDIIRADDLANIAGKIDLKFRYWELLVVTDPEDAEARLRLVKSIPNMRLLQVRSDLPGYRRRLCAANEAIGDIVIISAPDEIGQVDIFALIDKCEGTESIITTQRQQSSMLNPLLIAIGKSAGFRVDTRDMVTVAYPRSIINRLLRHSDAALALRFLPTDRDLPVIVTSYQGGGSGASSRSIRRLSYRLGILRIIIVNSAPRVLGLVELLSLTLAVAAILFSLYATVAWLTFDHVQPGWYTTSLLLSSTATFLGFAIFGLSIGLERLLDLSVRQVADDVLEEVNSIDLFSSVMGELNIEMDLKHRVEILAPPENTEAHR